MRWVKSTKLIDTQNTQTSELLVLLGSGAWAWRSRRRRPPLVTSSSRSNARSQEAGSWSGRSHTTERRAWQSASASRDARARRKRGIQKEEEGRGWSASDRQRWRSGLRRATARGVKQSDPAFLTTTGADVVSDTVRVDSNTVRRIQPLRSGLGESRKASSSSD
jgi:hypothetical protein